MTIVQAATPPLSVESLTDRSERADFPQRPIPVRSSCKSMVGFIIPPCLALVWGMPPAGPLCSPGITPVHSYYRPIRQALAFPRTVPPRLARVPCFRGISPRDEEPFPVSDSWPCTRAAALHSAGGSSRRPCFENYCCLRRTPAGSATRNQHCRSLVQAFTHRCGPRTRSPRRTRLCRWAPLGGISPPSAIQAMRFESLTASGLSPYGSMSSSALVHDSTNRRVAGRCVARDPRA